MATRQRLQLTQRQRLALTPALRESLALLQMPADRVEAAIAREAAENPFLQVTPPRARAAISAHDVALDTTPARESLCATLRGQLALMTLAAPTRAIAMHLAGDLNDDGYLDSDLDEVAAHFGAPRAQLDAAVAALQACEPAGVGARDLAECLALQLIDRGVAAATARAVVGELARFARGDWAGLERALGLPRVELRALARTLQGLSPRPAPEPPPPAAPLVPDLVVERDAAGRLTVRRTHEYMPRLRIDHALLQRAGRSDFADACTTRARALMRALRFRDDTLMRVGRHILERQHAFLAGARPAPQPLSRAETAAALELHPSTVGRAVAGKALAADGMLHPLDSFFSNALATRDGPVSAAALRRRIAGLIAAEPADRPLSDSALCAQLRAEGVDIARRTVAKYRQGLRLPASSRRRRAGAGH